MRLKHLFFGVSAALFALGCGAAFAGKTVDHAGTIACVVDKWDEKEMAKGHKLAVSVFRCVLIPDDAAAPKVAETCGGHYASGRRARISKTTFTRRPAAPANIRA